MRILAAAIASIGLSLGIASCNSGKTDAGRQGEQPGDDLYMFTSFHEPADEGLRFLYSEDGIHWDSIAGTWLKPELGMNIMRDPSIVVGPDSTYHLVWTIAWKGDTGFGYSSSKDLIHWTEQRRIPAMDSIASTQNLWAPELFYDDVKEQFMIIYASCVPDAGFDVGVEDVNNNHRLYYVTTKDFESFSEPKLFYDPRFSCIDAVLVKRGPEDYVMVVKDNTRPNRNIKVAFAKSAEGPYSAASEPFTESFTEGPTVVKIGDDYYIYYDTYQKYTYSAHKTRDFVNFTDVTDSVSVPKNHKHGTIFRAPRPVVNKLIEASKK